MIIKFREERITDLENRLARAEEQNRSEADQENDTIASLKKQLEDA